MSAVTVNGRQYDGATRVGFSGRGRLHLVDDAVSTALYVETGRNEIVSRCRLYLRDRVDRLRDHVPSELTCSRCFPVDGGETP